MVRVGLTGGIASGKSAALRMFAELGAVTIDADALAREAVAPGTEGLDEVVAAFGTQVLDANGALDRERLGTWVFADDQARARLEAVVHPRVRAAADALEAEAVARDPDAIVVHDIPLLAETGQADRFDLVVVADVSRDEQLRRLTELRGMPEDEARVRIESQADRSERLAIADVVLSNEGTLDELRQQVRDVVATLP